MLYALSGDRVPFRAWFGCARQRDPWLRTVRLPVTRQSGEHVGILAVTSP